MKKYFYLLIAPAILLLSANFAACNDDDNEPPIPATLKEVQEKVLGKWSSDNMELTFMPDQTIRIKHDDIANDKFQASQRNDLLPYMMQKKDNLVQLRIGEYDSEEKYEYMFIYHLSDNTMKIELYAENYYVTLSKTKL